MTSRQFTPEETERVWKALLHRCAAHRPAEHHLVKRLIMVSKDDLAIAINRADSDDASAALQRARDKVAGMKKG